MEEAVETDLNMIKSTRTPIRVAAQISQALSIMSSSSQPLVQHGHSVLIRTPRGDIKQIKAERNTCVFHIFFLNTNLTVLRERTAVIPKFGSFFCNELIGQPYGLTYEIVGKHLKLLPPSTIQEVGMSPASP